MIGHTRVRLPLGQVEFDGCVADIFESGVLTISNVRGEVQTLRWPLWIDATVFDAQGYPLYVVHPLSEPLQTSGVM